MKGQKTYEAALIKLREYVSEHHMRKSQVREMVLEIVCGLPQPFTAEQLAQACAAERISVGTIYNTVDLFIKAQIIHIFDRQFGNNIALYEVIPGRHVHLQIRCSKCGRVTEIHDQVIDNLIRMRKYPNFELQRYSLLIYGECKHCRKPLKVES